MEYRAEPELLDFLPETAENLRILVIEGRELIPPLAARLPGAEIWGVEPDPARQAVMKRECPQIRICSADYRKVPLPFAAGLFDYIIADHCLEQMSNAQDFALALYSWLKEDGHLLASFTNIRYWRHRQGELCSVRRRFFSLPEIKELLELSFYKEISLAASQEHPPKERGERLSAGGFGGAADELKTRAWIVKASHATAEAAYLKGSFSPPERGEIARRLRRIAYDIERRENCAALWDVCDAWSVSLPYLAAFIANTAVDPFSVLAHLVRWAGENGRQREGEDLLRAGAGIIDMPYREMMELQQVMGAMKNERCK